MLENTAGIVAVLVIVILAAAGGIVEKFSCRFWRSNVLHCRRAV